MPRRTRGTDNRALRLCRLLNRQRVRYLIAGGVAATLHVVNKPFTIVGDDPRVDILTVAAWGGTDPRPQPFRVCFTVTTDVTGTCLP